MKKNLFLSPWSTSLTNSPPSLPVPPPPEPFILQFNQRPPSSTPTPWPTNLVSSSKNNDYADRSTGPAVKAVYARYSRYVRGNLNDPCFSLFHGAMAACRVPSMCVYIYFADYLYIYVGRTAKTSGYHRKKMSREIVNNIRVQRTE